MKPYKYAVGDKVLVNGNLYQNPDGSGNYIEKENVTMYVVDVLDPAEYQYNYGIASSVYNSRQGWCSEDELKNA